MFGVRVRFLDGLTAKEQREWHAAYAELFAKPKSRCGNTIHSDHVTDHRCQHARGHAGDCLFGAVNVEPGEAVDDR